MQAIDVDQPLQFVVGHEVERENIHVVLVAEQCNVQIGLGHRTFLSCVGLMLWIEGRSLLSVLDDLEGLQGRHFRRKALT